MRALFLVAVVGSTMAFGQAPQFEAASVKAMPPVCAKCNVNNQMRMKGGPGTDDPGRIDYSGVTIQRLLMLAYGIQKSQIAGPDWVDSERFSIQATLPNGDSKNQFPLMLQNLLAERFKLTLHHETRELPAYVLAVGANGLKLRTTGFSPPPLADKDGFPDMHFPSDFQIAPGKAMFLQEGGHVRWTANQVSMSRLVETMAGNLDRPLVDLTDLHDAYDFSIYAKFPEDLGRDEVFPVAYGKLMEQLGLKLESRKMPVDVLAIDHVDKIPTEN